MLATILISAFVATAASSAPLDGAAAAAPGAFGNGVIEMAQANCNAAAQQVVAQTGGQLLSVSPGANGSCNVTVLVPGQGNERPRKVTVTVSG